MSFRESSWARWDVKTHGFVGNAATGSKKQQSTTLALGSGRQYDKAEEARQRASERAYEVAVQRGEVPPPSFKPRLVWRGSTSRPSRLPPAEFDSSSSLIPTRVPKEFPAGNSEPWLNAVAGKEPRFNDGECKNQPPRSPSPRFDRAGNVISRSRWDEKTRGYIGTDRMA